MICRFQVTENRCFQLSATCPALALREGGSAFPVTGEVPVSDEAWVLAEGLGVAEGDAVGVGVTVGVDVGVGVAVAVGVGVGVGVGEAHGMLINCSLSLSAMPLASSPPGATMLLFPTAVPYTDRLATFMFGPLLQVLLFGSYIWVMLVSTIGFPCTKPPYR